MASATTETSPPTRRKPVYKSLSAQVLFAIAVAIVLGYISPEKAIAMKPLGDAFIRLITMIIALVIFCTVVSGIAGMQDMKKVGRVGGKALLYFEVVSTIALAIGLVVGNVVQPGAGFNINPATLDPKAVAAYAGQAKAQSVTDFLMHIIPNTVIDAFAKGDILQVLLLAILFGFALSIVGQRAKLITDAFAALTHAVFGVINILMRLAPIGAFGAMAFTIGRYGLASLGPLAKLIALFWVTCILFVLIVLGAVAWLAGFNIIKFLLYIKEEILLVLAVSSSEPALPTLMEKMENLGCSRALVGLVVPTGYTFNTDGTSIYMTLAALFVAQATNTHLTLVAATDHLRGGRAHLQRRQRRAGRGVHRARRNHDGDSNHSRRRHGPDPGHRPLHEHVPRAHQYGRQRRRDGRGGPLGKRARPQIAPTATRLIDLANHESIQFLFSLSPLQSAGSDHL